MAGLARAGDTSRRRWKGCWETQQGILVSLSVVVLCPLASIHHHPTSALEQGSHRLPTSGTGRSHRQYSAEVASGSGALSVFPALSRYTSWR